jgi:type IV secretion system protein VirB6
MTGCAIVTDMGLVRDVLIAVDCNTRGFARAGYESLTMAGSPFQAALTLLLTLYVAITGYRLFFATGGISLSDGPGIVLKIGAILTLVTNWSVFQTLVFDMAAHAPVDIARAVTLPLRDGNALAADPLAGLQFAYDQLSAAAAAFAKAPKIAPGGESAAQTLAMASNILFVASAGLIAVLTVAIGVLTAIGPLFVALFLFAQTRGFFAGWIRALAAAAFGLFGAWTLIVLTLHALAPWLSALSERNETGLPDAQIGITTSVIVFIFAASQAGILLAGFMIARGFRLNFGRSSGPHPARDAAHAPPPVTLVSRPARLAEQLQLREEAYPYLSRTGAVAGGAGLRRLEIPLAAARPLGDFARRPAVTRHDRRREE